MRFTVIGHSTLFVEAGPTTVLVDPWLSGSCYWRSWWLFPPSAELDPAWLRPEHVYLTHHHFDHFHYPTLRRIDKRAHMLIPRFGVDVMPGELHALGFDDVRELQHGERVTIAPGVDVASYQYGFDDSAFVVAHEGTVLVDLNDCKMRGRSLARIVRDFGNPTFLFKTYSWAQAYPRCYDAEDPADLELISRDTYIDDFVATARALRPRYAVPFGSMVAFLHPESMSVNDAVVTPVDVANRCAKTGELPGSDVVVMAPGDSWSSETGFDIADVDWYTERAQHVAALARSVKDRVEAQSAAEAERTLTFDAFAGYFQQFLDALPPLSTRAMLKRPIAFHVASDSQPYWIVDFKHRRVVRACEPPSDVASVIAVAEGVLADAIDKRLVNFIHISMRLRTRVAPGGTSDDLAFWGVLAIWEIGYLPARRLLNRRFLEVLWRRRREAVDIAAALRGRGSVLTRMSTTFTPSREPAAARARSTEEAGSPM
jgi:UDP-MurNAc hydroxylase